MGTSVYFNNQNATREQFLIEDLIIESIKNHGIDIYYLPRESRSSLDEIYGDDPVKAFLKAYPIEMYLETFNEFGGNQEFFAKFGLELQKTAKIAVARRTFERYIPTTLRNTPKEGDLIWLPIQQRLLEIKHVEEEKNFFQAGKKAPYMFGLSIETFKYNGEFFDTGILEIDVIQDTTSFAVEYTMNAGGTLTYEESEQVYQGASLATATATGYVADWNRPTLKLRLRNIKGAFAANTAIIGTVSNASWTMASGNVQEDANDLFDDNVRIESEADNIVDWSETNPFGSSDE
jgi:hypothetical protein